VLFIKGEIIINTSSNTFNRIPNVKDEWIIKAFSQWIEDYKPANPTSVEIFRKWEEIKKGKV
jgi:hypothetical protein